MTNFCLKNYAWLQQFQISIESFKWCTFNEKHSKKNQQVNWIVSPFPNSYNIRKPYPLHLKFETITQNPC